MKTIKTISGLILLYFYYLHRTNPDQLDSLMINYNKYSKEIREGVSVDNDLYEKLKELTENNNIDLINSLEYLSEKNFIRYADSKPDLSGNTAIYSISITSIGVDIIENIELGSQEKKNFEVNFNITVNNNFNIESLLKAELGSLIKASVLGL